MRWYEVLINLAVGIVSGVIASLITSVLIERRIKQKENYKSKLRSLYIFFSLMEVKQSKVTPDELENALVNARIVFKNDKELDEKFKVVDASMTAVLRIIKNGGNATYDFSSEDFFNFVTSLERKM